LKAVSIPPPLAAGLLSKNFWGNGKVNLVPPTFPASRPTCSINLSVSVAFWIVDVTRAVEQGKVHRSSRADPSENCLDAPHVFTEAVVAPPDVPLPQ